MKKEGWICPFCGQGNMRNKKKCEFCKRLRPKVVPISQRPSDAGGKEESAFGRAYYESTGIFAGE